MTTENIMETTDMLDILIDDFYFVDFRGYTNMSGNFINSIDDLRDCCAGTVRTIYYDNYDSESE